MANENIRKILDKLLREPGVCGYSIRENKIIIYVEDERTAAAFSSLEFSGYVTEVRTLGKLQPL